MIRVDMRSLRKLLRLVSAPASVGMHFSFDGRPAYTWYILQVLCAWAREWLPIGPR